MKDQYSALMLNLTWSLTHLLPSAMVVDANGCSKTSTMPTVVFKIKLGW